MNLSLKIKQPCVILTTLQQIFFPPPTHPQLGFDGFIPEHKMPEKAAAASKSCCFCCCSCCVEQRVRPKAAFLAHSQWTYASPSPATINTHHHQRLYKHANTLILSRDAVIHKITYRWLQAKAGPANYVSVFCEKAPCASVISRYR